MDDVIAHTEINTLPNVWTNVEVAFGKFWPRHLMAVGGFRNLNVTSKSFTVLFWPHFSVPSAKMCPASSRLLLGS